MLSADHRSSLVNVLLFKLGSYKKLMKRREEIKQFFIEKSIEQLNEDEKVFIKHIQENNLKLEDYIKCSESFTDSSLCGREVKVELKYFSFKNYYGKYLEIYSSRYIDLDGTYVSIFDEGVLDKLSLMKEEYNVLYNTFIDEFIEMLDLIENKELTLTILKRDYPELYKIAKGK